MSKTPLLKRRLNPFLLASTVLVLSLLAGLSVMYQGQLSDLVGDKKSLNEEIEQKTQEIAELENETSRLSTQLETAQSDRGQLQNQLTDREAQIDSLNTQIADKNQEISGLEDERDSLETELAEAESNASTFYDELEVVCQAPDENLTDLGDEFCDNRGW